MSISNEINLEVHKLKQLSPVPTWSEIANILNESFGRQHTPNAYRKSYGRWKKKTPGDPYTHTAEVLTELAAVYESATEEDDESLIAKLLSDAGLDNGAWEVESAQVNSYDMPLKSMGGTVVHRAHSVKARIKPVGAGVSAEDLLDRIAEIGALENASAPVTQNASGEGALFIPSIYDVHLEKQAADAQEGMEEALPRLYLRCLRKMMGRVSSQPVGHTMFVIGNDFGNFDNVQGTTTKGTPQQNRLTFHAGVELRCALVVAAVNLLRTLSPVSVLCVPGNHDEATSVWLAKYVDAYFRAADDVDVVIETGPRLYRRWGENMLMFTHGNGFKPQNAIGIMAHEDPASFAATKFKEVFCGHFHTYRSLAAPIADNWGVMVRFLPGLSLTDKWHEKNQYVGSRRGAIGYLFDPDEGLIGEYPVFVG